MPLTRKSEQSHATLEEHFINFKADPNAPKHWPLICDNMLQFVEVVNELFPETQLFALTSHLRIVVQPTDDVHDFFVIASNVGTNDYYFEYLLPARKRPWESAFVTGTASSLENAKKYLLIAMHECGAWEGNGELEKRMVEHSIAH